MDDGFQISLDSWYSRKLSIRDRLDGFHHRAYSTLAAQQGKKQYARRIDVGRGCHCAAGHLFGRGVTCGQGAPVIAGQKGRLTGLLGVFEQFSDAEVQQLHMSIRRHQYVRRFDVTMDDQIRMRMGDCAQHVEEQANTRLSTQAAGVAVAVDVFSFEELQDKIWLGGR